MSTDGQSTDSQTDELVSAGCSQVFVEKRSGAIRERPELARAMASLRAGDVLVVVRLDRLARSAPHLLGLIESIEARGGFLRSLRDPVDTSTPQGVFSLQVVAAVAQLERGLIRERTLAGLRAAQARGARPGNPGLRSRDPAAIASVALARREAHGARLVDSMDSFMPTVRAMRPRSDWSAVASALSLKGTAWTPDRLRRSVRRLVREGLADPALLGRSGSGGTRRDGLDSAIRGLLAEEPARTLASIASRFMAMRVPTPRGHASWTPSTVRNLIQGMGGRQHVLAEIAVERARPSGPRRTPVS